MLAAPTSLPILPRPLHCAPQSSPRNPVLSKTRRTPVFDLHSTSPESFGSTERTILRSQLDKAGRRLVEFREGMEPRLLSPAELEKMEGASDVGSWATDGGVEGEEGGDAEGGAGEGGRNVVVVDSPSPSSPAAPASTSSSPPQPIHIEGFDLPPTPHPLPRRAITFPFPSPSPSTLSTLLASFPSPPLPPAPSRLEPSKPAWNDNALLLALASTPRSISPSPALTPIAPYPPTRFLVSASPPCPHPSTQAEKLELTFVRRPESVRTGNRRVVLGGGSRSPERRERREKKRRASSGGESDYNERAYVFEPSVFASHRSNSCASLSSATSLPPPPSRFSARPQAQPQPASSWMAFPAPGLAVRKRSEGEPREGTLKRLRREQAARRLEEERVEKESAGEGEMKGRGRRLFFF